MGDVGAAMQENREAVMQKDREAAGGRNGMEREYSRGLCDGDVRTGGESYELDCMANCCRNTEVSSPGNR